MPRLLLSGGGSAEDSHLLDQLLVQLTAKGRMLYVPIALDPHHIPYASCYEWIRSVFTPLGLDRITMWSDLSAKTEADLNPFSALYIGGGNTYKLLRDLKQARFDQAIRLFLQHGGVVYGGSAGAIVCGRDISTASLLDRNEVGLEDTTGLDVLQGASVWCHYQPTDDQRIHSATERLQHPTIALSEKQECTCKTTLCLRSGLNLLLYFSTTFDEPSPHHLLSSSNKGQVSCTLISPVRRLFLLIVTCDSAKASTSTDDERYSRTAFPGQKLPRSLVVIGSNFLNAAVGVSVKCLKQAYVQHLDGNATLSCTCLRMRPDCGNRGCNLTSL